MTVADAAGLRRLLDRIDGRGYGAYKELYGTWSIGPVEVDVEKVQPDPFAPPTRLRIRVPSEVACLPADLFSTPARTRALEDHLARLLAGHMPGTPFRIDAGGQEVLDRTCCYVDGGDVTLRIAIDLPDRKRRVRGARVAGYLVDDLPTLVEQNVRWSAIDARSARTFVETVEDAVALREQLPDLGLVAFVGDGAILPRRSGVDDRPLDPQEAVPFASPAELRATVDVPNRGQVTGMGVPEGVTLIVGGGFHGKSTLLRAIERGVYDHVPGDGRELVVARDDAVKVRAEDGRRVARVDVSAFVADLPTGDVTDDFSTENASGSTSQAANIVEAIEAGAGVLLVDEDTSATNLMIRDLRMQALVTPDREPLTPFTDLVRPLRDGLGLSTVLVVGGSGDYFDVADHVVRLDAFRPSDVTVEARQVAADHPGRTSRMGHAPRIRHRVVDPASVNPRRRGRMRTKPRGTDALVFGEAEVDLSAVEQLVDRSQAAGVASALVRLVEDGILDGRRTIAEALDDLDDRLVAGGMEALRGGYPGDLARPRRFEIAAALNRLRTLRISDLRT